MMDHPPNTDTLENRYIEIVAECNEDLRNEHPNEYHAIIETAKAELAYELRLHIQALVRAHAECTKRGAPTPYNGSYSFYEIHQEQSIPTWEALEWWKLLTVWRAVIRDGDDIKRRIALETIPIIIKKKGLSDAIIDDLTEQNRDSLRTPEQRNYCVQADAIPAHIAKARALHKCYTRRVNALPFEILPPFPVHNSNNSTKSNESE